MAPVQILHGINTGNPWFSTSSFTQPTGVAFGSTGRNIIQRPRAVRVESLAVQELQDSASGSSLECAAETFNFTNTPQFSNPQHSLTSSTYGYVTGTIGSGTGVNGTGGGRAIQLGVKIRF